MDNFKVLKDVFKSSMLNEDIEDYLKQPERLEAGNNPCPGTAEECHESLDEHDEHECNLPNYEYPYWNGRHDWENGGCWRCGAIKEEYYCRPTVEVDAIALKSVLEELEMLRKSTYAGP